MERRGRRSSRGNRVNFKSEKGYLLVSTLFFLIFSAIFAGSMIRISGIQILQYNQLTTAYEAKAALNMSETILLDHLETNETINNGEMNTSVGKITISSENQTEGIMYHLNLTTSKGLNFARSVWVGHEVSPEFENLQEPEEIEKPEVLEGELEPVESEN